MQDDVDEIPIVGTQI